MNVARRVDSHQTVKVSETRADSYKNGRQSPDLQFLGGKSMFLALAAVVQLVFTQLFFLRESFEASVQTNRLRLLQSAGFHALMLSKQLSTHTQAYTQTDTHTYTHTYT